MHRAPPRLRVFRRRLHLVHGRLGCLELLPLVDDGTRFLEPLTELFRPRIDGFDLDPPGRPAPDRSPEGSDRDGNSTQKSQPALPDERQSEIVSRTRDLIERGGGTWDAHDVWGRRKLAYEIDHKTDGAYHLLTFSAEPEALAEVSRVLKITDGVMRHLAVRRPERRPRRTVAPSS